MKAHALAQLLLDGPDLEVCIESDHPATAGNEYVVTTADLRRLYWHRVKLRHMEGNKHLFSETANVRHADRMDAPPVEILVLGSGDDVERAFTPPED